MQLTRLLIVLLSCTISMHALSLKHELPVAPKKVQSSKKDIIKKVALWTGIALGSVLIIAGSIVGYREFSKYSFKNQIKIQKEMQLNRVKIDLNNILLRATTPRDIDDDVKALKIDPQSTSYLEGEEATQLITNAKQRVKTNYDTVVALTKKLGKEYELTGEITDGVDTLLDKAAKVTLLMKVLSNVDSIPQRLFEEIFQALLDANANTNAKDNKGLTPFDYLKNAMIRVVRNRQLSTVSKQELLNRTWKYIATLQAYDANITDQDEKDLRKTIVAIADYQGSFEN